MKSDECSGALLLRSRQVALSRSDELLLEAHLAVCGSCRVLRLVTSDFDAAAQADRHDAMRIERLASLARQTTLERRRAAQRALAAKAHLPLVRARGVRGLLLAAAVFLMVAGASAAIVVQRAVRDQERVTRTGVAASELGLPLGENARRVVRRLSASVRSEVAPVAEALGSPDELLGLAETSADPSSADAPSVCPATGCFAAAALFREANEARRQGRTQAAIAAYRELQRRAPASREAQMSHLSLGNLLLATGNGALALPQFDAALRSAAARNVQAEALYGRGLALGRLGRLKQERANWQRLLESFASSPYAAHARRRLGALD